MVAGPSEDSALGAGFPTDRRKNGSLNTIVAAIELLPAAAAMSAHCFSTQLARDDVAKTQGSS